MAENNKLTPEQMREFPKVELHRHLEGSFQLDQLYEIAQKNGLEVPATLAEFKKQNQFPKDGEPDFLLFLSKFKTDWYSSLEDVYNVAYSSTKHFSNDGLFYIEVRFSPEHFALKNDFDRLEVTRTVIQACDKAAQEEGIKIRYLITLNRGKQKWDEMKELFDYISQASDRIVGYDLAGDETNFPPEDFIPFFQYIHDKGYKATIHAGEVTPSQQVWIAIDQLFARRIGHGTSTIKDEKLQKELIKRNIPLEFCMTSNYQTGSWREIQTHPFGRLYKAGVPVTLNSDDPTIQNADLTDDYLIAQKNFDMGIEDFIKVNQISINTSFYPEAEKKQLEKDYLDAVAAFRKKHNL